MMIPDHDPGHAMVDALISPEHIKGVYDKWSRWYYLIEPLEYYARREGVKAARVVAGETVLEAGVGLGFSFLEFLKRAGTNTVVHGVDLSSEMIRRSRRRAIRHRYSNFDLRVADIRHLPYGDEVFDLVFSSYVLDLLPIEDLNYALAELLRVLKRGGRLVLVNLTKRSSALSLYERVYRLSPTLCGGCRPIFMRPLLEQAGCGDVQRRLVRGPLTLEIVTARKPWRSWL